MRLLYVSRGSNPHDLRFLAALGRTRNEIIFLPLEAFPVCDREAIPANVQVLESLGRSGRIHWWELPGTVWEFERLVDQVRPDLVHAGPIQSGAALAAAAGCHPLVSMSWGSDLLSEASSGMGRALARYALRRTDVLVCDCEAVRRAAVDLGMPSERIVVFPWGVDLNQFTPGQDGGLRRRLGWDGAFVILSTRAWEPLYGLDVIVEAFIRAVPEAPALRMVMLGEGSMQARLLKRLEQVGLIERIHAPGMIDSDVLPAYYGEADLYVSASHSDGSSISLLEAMACGLPALVSDIPGNREWVVPERTGWWFVDGNAQDLARRLLEAISRREVLSDMGMRAREVAQARADWKVNFGRLLQAYEMAVSLSEAEGRGNIHTGGGRANRSDGEPDILREIRRRRVPRL